jgi:hypothetical protein
MKSEGAVLFARACSVQSKSSNNLFASTNTQLISKMLFIHKDTVVKFYV